MNFTSHGYEYSIDHLGVIHQLNPQPYVYDQTYVSTYDTDEYKRQSDILQALRLGFTIAAHKRKPESILDFGYGNGAFIKFAKQHIDKVIGYDISGVEVEGCETYTEIKPAEVVTFWDALEHVNDLSFLETIKCETIVISLPYCHFPNQENLNWFNDLYKHRKPNEHLHHFNPVSLKLTMQNYGWREVARSTHEDIVRKSTHGKENILTMAFKRYNYLYICVCFSWKQLKTLSVLCRGRATNSNPT